MTSNLIPFNVKTSTINESILIHVIDIPNIDVNLKQLLDKHIVHITQGQNDATNLSTAKKELQQFFSTKNENIEKIGPIAEFFIHLYLNEVGFEQQCLFLNLEERSVKKGFDGYYTFNNVTWIMESKSGLSSTKNISHKVKIKEAYSSLRNTLSGDVSNNPWRNAYNHAHRVNATSDILSTLKQFSDSFINGNKTHDIKDFNIIPCSTIFYLDNWSPQDKEEIITAVKETLTSLSCKSIHIICLNKATVNAFMDYLSEGID